jgi:hypothetical protein
MFLSVHIDIDPFLYFLLCSEQETNDMNNFRVRQQAGKLSVAERNLVDIFGLPQLRELRIAILLLCHAGAALRWALLTHGAQLTLLCLTEINWISVESVVLVKLVCRQLESFQLDAVYIVGEPLDAAALIDDEDDDVDRRRIRASAGMDWPSLKLFEMRCFFGGEKVAKFLLQGTIMAQVM